MNATNTDPPWKRGYDAMTVKGLIAVGQRFSTRELYAIMGIPETPTRYHGENDKAFARRSKTWALRNFQPQTTELATAILEGHGLYLRSIGSGPNRPGEWEIVDAASAGRLAKVVVKDIRASLRKTRGVILRLRAPTAQLEAEKNDAAARLAQLEGLMRLK